MAVTQTIDTIMRRISQLLALAEHPNTPVAEAQSARARAERLVNQHRIDENRLSAEDKAVQGIKPISTEWLIGEGREFRQSYLVLATNILRHVGALFHASSDWDSKTGDMIIKMHCFGFESDLVYAEMLFQAARLGFGEALEPRIDGALSDEDNVYRMRSAGMERNRIANALWGSAFDDGAAHGKVQRLYKSACAKRGDDASVGGKGFNTKVYRVNFADAFVRTMNTRLFQARIAAGQDGTEMVLQSRVEEVKEAFWEAYPQYRPQPIRTLPNAGETGRSACNKCANAKSGYCRDHAYLRPRKHTGGIRYNEDAQRAGTGAARRVDLGVSGNRLDS